MSRTEAPEVEKEIGIVHYAKYFGHVIVKWQIDNFCLRTCKENSFIQSQDFYVQGTAVTKWKVILNPKTNDRRISLCLQRLKVEPGPETVAVNWRFVLMQQKPYHINVVENGYGVFQMDSSCVIDMHETGNVYKKLRPLDSDEIEIECHLIVVDGCILRAAYTAPDEGIKSLSSDLSLLYTESALYDIVLKTGGDKFIRAHKAILHCRNAKFAELLKKEKDVVDLSRFKYETIEKLTYFIYSGNIQNFLMKPTIDSYDCLIFFRMDHALLYYLPEELSFHTVIDVQSISYLWSISNYSSQNDFSSAILKGNSNTTWQIHVSSNSRFDGREYVSFAAEIIEGAKPQGICVEFGVIDANQNMLCLNRILKNIEENELSRRIFLVERFRHEIDPFIENDTLHVVVRIRMAPGTYSISTGKSTLHFTTSNKNDNLYYAMSNNMIRLVASDQFSDVTLRTNDGTIMSHKCILYARSTYFAMEICKLNPEKNEINVNISSSTLKLMLFYIYSGQIMLSDSTDLSFYPIMTIAANYLGISCCKISTSQALKNMMSVPNVSAILVYAEKFKDIELKSSAIAFIRLNYASVAQQESFINLGISHSSLFKKVTAAINETTS